MSPPAGNTLGDPNAQTRTEQGEGRTEHERGPETPKANSPAGEEPPRTYCRPQTHQPFRGHLASAAVDPRPDPWRSRGPPAGAVPVGYEAIESGGCDDSHNESSRCHQDWALIPISAWNYNYPSLQPTFSDQITQDQENRNPIGK